MKGWMAVLALAVGLPALAAAQDAYSVDDYLERLADADASFAALQALDPADSAFAERATEALRDRVALITYLGGWMRAGMDPEMQSSALQTRAVLYQNVVTIYAEMGNCVGVADTTEQLAAFLAEHEVGSIGEDALLEARTNLATCEMLGASAPPPRVDADAPDLPDEAGAGDDGTPSEDGTHAVSGASGPGAVGASSDAVEATSAWPWIAVGTGAALVGGGLLVATGPLDKANQTVSAWNESDDPGPAPDDVVDAADRIPGLHTAATAMVGVGAVGVLGGLAWFVLDRRQDTVDVAVTPTRGGAMGTLSIRW